MTMNSAANRSDAPPKTPPPRSGKAFPRHPKCPRCGHFAAHLTVRHGKLYVADTDTQVTGWVCLGCGRPVHWGVRGDENPPK